jgi:hypothetical protein
VTVSVAVPVLFAASRAVTVMTLLPGCSAMLLTVQFVVPVAVPLPPALFDQLTCVTPMLSDAVPPSANGLVFVVNAGSVVGVVMATVGAIAS